MYKCLKSDFPKFERKIKRIIKKLEKYGLEYKFEILEETIEPIRVIDVSIPNQSTVIDELFLEVVNYNFSMDSIKLGNFNTIAILKHHQIENSNENLVYSVDLNVSLPNKYRTIESKCDHCNTNRKRNTTVILENLDNPGELLQIGLTCLKEYTGIDDVDVIKNFMDLEDIFNQDLYLKYGFDTSNYQPLAKTEEYLAHSIYLIEKEGYIKDVTKGKAFDYSIRGLEIHEKDLEKARKTMCFFEERDFQNNDFMQNIKLLLQNNYNKVSGLIAYAYLAYLKQKEYEENKKNNDASNKLSNYVGNIGDRLEIEVNLVNRYTFETFYGHQQLYIFKDLAGNLFKWTTSVYLVDLEGKSIELNNNKIKLRGTVKGHEEYKGTKQTELTRCKIVAFY